MARFRRSSSAARTIVVRQPAARTPTIRVVAPSTITRVKKGARRVGRAAVGAAADEKHTLVAVGAALAMGYAKKEGIDLPNPTPFSDEATYGLAAWAWGKWGKNRTARHAGTGLLAIAAYNWMSSGSKEKTSGVGVSFEDDDE